MHKLDNITILIPIHELKDSDKEFLNTALDSIKQNKDYIVPNILFVIPESNTDLKLYLETLEFDSTYVVNITTHNQEPTYQNQINHGVETCKTDWFFIMELDDSVRDYCFEYFSKYMEKYPSVTAFTNVNVELNINNQLIRYINEISWADESTYLAGTYTLDIIKKHANSVHISGALINKESYQDVGGLKHTMKHNFVQEFLLRYLNRSQEMFCIPKLLYIHRMDREGSYFYDIRFTESKKLYREELNYWNEAAEKEYFFTDDNIKPFVIEAVEKAEKATNG